VAWVGIDKKRGGWVRYVRQMQTESDYCMM
jgi:hypothetical protein